MAACTGPTPDGTRVASAPSPLHDRSADEGRRLAVRLEDQRDRAIVLNRWFSLQKDCSLQDMVKVALVFPPSHGQVVIAPGRYKPDYPADSYRAACNDAPRDGIGATYQPVSGFIGQDSMTLRIALPSGKSWLVDYTVGVR